MIDLLKSKNQFIKYTEKFDLQNVNIKRKQLHSLRVMNISKKIAESIALNEEENKLAILIGLLHDIGRFEQFTQYGTFRDRESIDHGNLGVEILQKDDYIKKYINNENYIDIIYKAIRNHNKYQTEKGLNKKQELFCNIIKDADKIDILYEATGIFYTPEQIKEINESLVTEELLSKIYEKKAINRNEFREKGKLIDVFVILAFLFDINCPKSFEIIYEEDYINKIFQRFNFKNEKTKIKIEEIRKFLNRYIKDNLGL